MTSFIFPRRVKVNKTDSGTIDVSGWLSGEDIGSLEVTCPNGLANVVGSAIDGGKLSVLYTGVAVGEAVIHFAFGANSPRTDCIKVTLFVIDDC